MPEGIETAHPHLNVGERVVAVHAEPAHGPGWRNTPLWVIVRGANGGLRELCLQPHEQGAILTTLYPVAACLHGQLVAAALAAIGKGGD